MKLTHIGIGILCAIIALFLHFHGVSAWTVTYVGDIYSSGEIDPAGSFPAAEYFSRESSDNNSNSGTITDGSPLTADYGLGTQTGDSKSGDWENGHTIDTYDHNYSFINMSDKVDSHISQLGFSNYPTTPTSIGNDSSIESAISTQSSGFYTVNDTSHGGTGVVLIDEGFNLSNSSQRTIVVRINGHLDIQSSSPVTIEINNNSTLIFLINGRLRMLRNITFDVETGSSLIFLTEDSSQNIIFNSVGTDTVVTNDPGGLISFISNGNIIFRLQTNTGDCDSEIPSGCGYSGIFIAEKDIILENLEGSNQVWLYGMLLANNSIILKDDDTDPKYHVLYQPRMLVDIPPIGTSMFYSANTSIQRREVAP